MMMVSHGSTGSLFLTVAVLLLTTCVTNVSCLTPLDDASGHRNLPKNVVVSKSSMGGPPRTFALEELSPTAVPSSVAATTTQSSNMKNHRNNLGMEAKQGVLLLQKIRAALRSTFLPTGYPTRTPPAYLRYCIWSWIQDGSTQLRSVLATQKILEGVGVGKEGATALSALMNFLLRDGCGMAATLLFTSCASSIFRTDIKRWRLLADIMNDIGITLEVAAVLVPPQAFLPMICVGNMCKAICGVAAGACGGAINLYWARGSDISDINAKFGAQHTVTGSLGLIFAALFAQSVSNWKVRNLWLLQLVLTALHIYANMRCMRLLVFDSLNNGRLQLVMDSFLQQGTNFHNSSNNNSTNEQQQQQPLPILSPERVSKLESLFFWFGQEGKKCPALPKKIPLYFGESFNAFVDKTNLTLQEIHTRLLDDHDPTYSSSYLLAAGQRSKKNGKPCVCVVLKSTATPIDQTKAYLHSMLLGRELEKVLQQQKQTKSLTYADQRYAERTALHSLSLAWEHFQHSCQLAGWDLTKTELRTLGYEITMQS